MEDSTCRAALVETSRVVELAADGSKAVGGAKALAGSETLAATVGASVVGIAGGLGGNGTTVGATGTDRSVPLASANGGAGGLGAGGKLALGGAS